MSAKRPPGVWRRLSWLGAVFLAVLTAPDTALACTVCPLGSGQNSAAYIYTGILITATQVACVGSLIWWWRKRLRDADLAADARDPD